MPETAKAEEDSAEGPPLAESSETMEIAHAPETTQAAEMAELDYEESAEDPAESTKAASSLEA